MIAGGLVQNEDLTRIPSVRRNPVIAEVFQRLDYMERRGSGFQKMLDGVKEKSNLEVYSTPTTFIVTFKNMNYNNEEFKELVKIKKEGINDGLNEGINDGLKLTKNEEKIYEIIKKNNEITQEELAEKLNLSESTVYRALSELQKNEVIIREGSKKTGYWKILK